MIEIITKLVISFVVAVLIYWQVIFLIGVWKSQIDPRATVTRILKSLAPESKVIVTRDVDKIYQNGIVVGVVVGVVQESDGNIIFPLLCETARLDRSRPFEYGRRNLKYVKHESLSLQQLVQTGDGSKMRSDVLNTTVCTVTDD